MVVLVITMSRRWNSTIRTIERIRVSCSLLLYCFCTLCKGDWLKSCSVVKLLSEEHDNNFWKKFRNIYFLMNYCWRFSDELISLWSYDELWNLLISLTNITVWKGTCAGVIVYRVSFNVGRKKIETVSFNFITDYHNHWLWKGFIDQFRCIEFTFWQIQFSLWEVKGHVYSSYCYGACHRDAPEI